MSKKYTLHDLARAAKVSPATVSRVAAGNPTVDPAIRSRVRETAKKYGMRLEDRRKDKSRLIAFLLANRDVMHSFQGRILLGAERYCALHNWELLFMSFHYTADTPAKSLHLPQLLSGRTHARAIILGGTNSANLFQSLRQRQIPFSILGNNVVGPWEPEHYDVVYSDDIQGAYEATVCLISKGHRKIGFLGNLDLSWFERCARGYRKAMEEAKLPVRCVDIRSDGSELGYIGAKTLLRDSDRVTAIFAGTDQVATGAYAALRESSLAVPENISLVGFNDTQGSLFYPPLTSVREFPEELGRHLSEFVFKRLENPELAPQKLTIPTRLVARDSVQVLPAADRSKGEAAAARAR